MFRNREDAGLQLAERLRDMRLHDAVVLGMPRGGMVVAATIARELDAELDVLLIRKLRAPWQRELAIGSVAESGEVYTHEDIDAVPGLTPEYLSEECRFQCEELKHRRATFRAVRDPARIAGRSVIVADEGIATGSTMLAALDVLSRQDPYELIAALPVAPASRIHLIESCCDHLVCLHYPNVYYSVGQFYEDFERVSDHDVLALLGGQHSAAVR